MSWFTAKKESPASLYNGNPIRLGESFEEKFNREARERAARLEPHVIDIAITNTPAHTAVCMVQGMNVVQSMAQQDIWYLQNRKEILQKAIDAKQAIIDGKDTANADLS